MNKQLQLFLIALAGITLMISVIANIQYAEASNAGFNDGKRAGASDARNDRAPDDDCPSSNDLYCLAYITGYRIGYEAGRFID